MSLPPEIRARIYEFVFCDAKIYLDWPRCFACSGLSTALLRVCRPVYTEALPLMMPGITWIIQTYNRRHSPALNAVLDHRAIQHLCIDEYQKMGPTGLLISDLKRFNKLSTVEIEIYRFVLSPPRISKFEDFSDTALSEKISRHIMGDDEALVGSLPFSIIAYVNFAWYNWIGCVAENNVSMLYSRTAAVDLCVGRNVL